MTFNVNYLLFQELFKLHDDSNQ